MHFSIESLEYDRFKAMLSRYVRSQRARKILDELMPSSDRPSLESRHELVTEAMEYLRDRAVRFPEIPALESVLDRLGPGGITFEIPEVEAVQEFVSDVVGFSGGWGDEEAGFPRLTRRVLELPDLSARANLLARAIRAGEIREEYSPELRRLRKELESSRGRLNQRLRSIVKTFERSGQLQEALVTVRNGRFVLPVRSEHQRAVQGIVHGSSSSGATVFMEPIETLEMNNDLVRIGEEEEREIRRILGELTDRIQDYKEELIRAAEVRAELELVFGIATWGRDFDC
ncbi:MAG TPA: hypothetical protein VLA34_13935, partial [Candidatus Krumholzibacterium sp.]|nr:hypothetical protein [Candidatus Krumholzibacterium sp.]